ncbi:MAG: amidophosphoribosyltransferase [Rickettsiales bacterium]
MFDGFREECGVFGVWGSDSAAALTVLGLHALQHRGQEAAGVVSGDGKSFRVEKYIGKVADYFTSKHVIEKLPGQYAVGHVRYSTSGEKQHRNVQPIFSEYNFGGMAIAHNGNLTNAAALRSELIKNGAIFQSTMDTEIFTHLVATGKKTKVADRLIEAFRQVEGAYSVVALTRKKLVGARDPYGVRPLILGRLGDAYVLASESCALDIIGAKAVRDVEPGEMVIIDEKGVESLHPFEKKPSRFCIFEYTYFARPDSDVEGRNVYSVRKAFGAELAREAKIDADVTVPLPDSGIPAALGYVEQSGLPLELGIIRNHYVGRTFIEPSDEVRHLGVKLKHNANAHVVRGKRVVLVDDTLVRGTTSKKIVAMVREAGATEVHLAIASPPTTHSCFYGVDTPDRRNLIAANHSTEEIAKIIGVDSLTFLSLDGLYRSLGEAGRNPKAPQFCDACFSGDYPIPIPAGESA